MFRVRTDGQATSGTNGRELMPIALLLLMPAAPLPSVWGDLMEFGALATESS